MVPQAMHLAGFTTPERNSKAKRMWIYQHLPSKLNDIDINTIHSINSPGSMSSITSISSSVSSAISLAASAFSAPRKSRKKNPQLLRGRWTGRQKQQRSGNSTMRLRLPHWGTSKSEINQMGFQQVLFLKLLSRNMVFQFLNDRSSAMWRMILPGNHHWSRSSWKYTSPRLQNSVFGFWELSEDQSMQCKKWEQHKVKAGDPS